MFARRVIWLRVARGSYPPAPRQRVGARARDPGGGSAHRGAGAGPGSPPGPCSESRPGATPPVSSPPHSEPAFARGGRQGAPAQQGQQPMLDLGPQTRLTRWRTSSRASRSGAGGIHTVGSKSPRRSRANRSASDPVIFEPSRGDGFRLLGVRQDGVVPQAFHQIHEPPPRPRRLNGDARPRREFREKLLQSRRIVRQSLLRDFSVWHSTRRVASSAYVCPRTCTIAAVSFRRVG